jgi:hypothetical protein
MKWYRRFTTLALALALATGVGCSALDSTAPREPAAEQQQGTPSFGLIGDLTGGLTSTVGGLTNTVVGTLGSVTDLLLCSRQPYAITTQSIGPKGGVIRVGSHTLQIPGNAVTGTVRITAEQVSGSTNSVRFSPEGLRFQKPATLTMSYENCALVLLQKKIVYTDEKLKILEVLTATLDLFKKKQVTAPIDHFSRYAVAW